jgi:chromosome segregation protein
VRGLVADVLRVDVEHAHVIEAALDGRDQWLLSSDSAAVVAAAEAFEELEGRVNLICTDRLGGGATGGPTVGSDEPENHGQSTSYDWNQHGVGLRLAVDLVRVEEADAPLAHHLLGHTAIVDDLAAAHALHRAGPSGWRYVTSSGDVVEADGTLRLGPLTAAMGLLSRHAELEVLDHQIAETDRRVEELSQQLSTGNEQAKQIEADVNALRNAAYQLNTQKVELTSHLAQNADKQNALQREQPVLDRELQGLLDQSGRLVSEQTRLTEQRTSCDQAQASHQQQAEALAGQQEETAENLRRWGADLTSARVPLGQVQEKQLASQQQVQRHQSAVAELGQQIERLAKSAEGLIARRGTLEQELDAAQQAEATLERKQQTLGEQGRQLADSLTEARHAVDELAGRVETVRGQHAEIEQQLHAVQMQLGELNVRLETLIQRTVEELELNLPERYAELAAQTDEAGAMVGYQPQDLDWQAVAAEIKELREKIQRLGNVNLDAIGEQEELEQRQSFLSAQVADLTTSKQQLEQLIGEINTESSLRFEQCFNAVREHFQGLFRTLFGGGKADIYLETEIEVKAKDGEIGEDGQPLKTIKKTVDVLDAGIEIIARPPGKQPVSISQLSGGEKTMTCVALLMSIFKSKPSPFCILDEVDAALDEANNQRFNLIVQEFLEQSQFIVITHSKRTMQIADVLYGVTMQEQGVSKRVAVKFDQVDSQGRISADAAAESEKDQADKKEYAAA